MLRQLYIRNYALIDELDMEFRSGFSVMTGETGAGKSIILGAIGLLLGQRADSKTVKMGTEKCVIEAHFDLSRYGMQPFFEENDIEFDANDTIIRRELTSAGKSRAFINDTPVALTMLKELGERLLVSQNMLRRAELDFLDDVKLEEASAALGVPIYPVESDGFALCDAMFGILPELRIPVREETGEKFYKYNSN